MFPDSGLHLSAVLFLGCDTKMTGFVPIAHPACARDVRVRTLSEALPSISHSCIVATGLVVPHQARVESEDHPPRTAAPMNPLMSPVPTVNVPLVVLPVVIQVPDVRPPRMRTPTPLPPGPPVTVMVVCVDVPIVAPPPVMIVNMVCAMVDSVAAPALMVDILVVVLILDRHRIHVAAHLLDMTVHLDAAIALAAILICPFLLLILVAVTIAVRARVADIGIVVNSVPPNARLPGGI